MTQLALFLFASLASPSPKPHAVRTEEQAVTHATAAVQRYRLTSDKPECVIYEADSEGASWVVRVREKHDPTCGGDPAVEPTLFYLKIRKRDGHTTTDRDTDDGSFQSLKIEQQP